MSFGATFALPRRSGLFLPELIGLLENHHSRCHQCHQFLKVQIKQLITTDNNSCLRWLKVLPTDLARLPRGEDLPGGGRPLLPLGLDPIPMAEREGDEARRGARGVVSEPRLEVKSCW